MLRTVTLVNGDTGLLDGGLNPSFGDAGPRCQRGRALGALGGDEPRGITGFGAPRPRRTWEDFERWFGLLDSIDDVVVVLAFFDSALRGYEEFEAAGPASSTSTTCRPRSSSPRPSTGSRRRGVQTKVEQRPHAREWAGNHRCDGVFDGEPRGLRGPVAQPALPGRGRRVTSSTAMFDADAQGRVGTSTTGGRARDDAVRRKP